MEWLAEAVERDTELLCAGATYAEVWRGHSQSPSAGQQAIRLAKALETLTAVPTDDVIGCGAGQLLAVAGRGGYALTLDAIVVATAVIRCAAVLTGNPDDIANLAVPAGVLVMTLPPASGRAPTPPGSRRAKKQRRKP